MAHVTHMIALNQSRAEKERNQMRVKQIAIREGTPAFKQAVVLQCLEIGRAVLDSRLEDQVDLEDEKPAAPAGGRSRGR
jgi:hypothetical protein